MHCRLSLCCCSHIPDNCAVNARSRGKPEILSVSDLRPIPRLNSAVLWRKRQAIACLRKADMMAFPKTSWGFRKPRETGKPPSSILSGLLPFLRIGRRQLESSWRSRRNTEMLEPSDFALASPCMLDRRGDQRTSTLKTGKISIALDAPGINCIILDISAPVARLRAATA